MSFRRRTRHGIWFAACGLGLAAANAAAVPVVLTYVYAVEAIDGDPGATDPADPLGIDGADLIFRLDFNTNFSGNPFFGGVVEIVNRPNGLPDVSVDVASNAAAVVILSGNIVLQIDPLSVDFSPAGLDWEICTLGSCGMSEHYSYFTFPNGFFSSNAPTELENLPPGQFSPGVTTSGAVGSVSVDLEAGFTTFNSTTTSQQLVYRAWSARGFHSRGPEVYRQPEDAVVPSGGTIELSARAIFRGASTTITWFRNGVPLANGGDVSGADTLTLSIANAGADDAGEYTVEVDANGGVATSEPAIVAVVPAP